MGKKKQRRSKDELVSSVLKISPKLVLEDEYGKYIPYCNFKYHTGIVKDINVRESRKCRHYQKYRLQVEKSNPWRNWLSGCAIEYYNKFF